MKKSKTTTIVFTALFAALICALTFFPKVPTPIGGYIHVGDSMIYLASNILPFPFGMLAGGIGGSLSDAIGGYWIYVIPTFIVKNINGLMFYILKTKGAKIISVKSVIAAALSSAVTVVGYFFVNGLLFTWKGAIASTPSEIAQGAGALIVFILVGLAFDKSRLTSKINVNL